MSYLIIIWCNLTVHKYYLKYGGICKCLILFLLGYSNHKFSDFMCFKVHNFLSVVYLSYTHDGFKLMVINQISFHRQPSASQNWTFSHKWNDHFQTNSPVSSQIWGMGTWNFKAICGKNTDWWKKQRKLSIACSKIYISAEL